MKRNRIFFILTALTLTFALAAMAQPAGRMGGQGNRGGGQPALGQGPDGGERFLVRYLELTEAQVTQWQAIRDAARASILPLAESRRENFDALRLLLDGTAPDPAAVGALVITNHAIGEQIRGIHENADAQFLLILTPEQKTKYEQWLELRKSMPRRGGNGDGPGMGQGGGMGFGQGNGGGFGMGPGDGTCPWGED